MILGLLIIWVLFGIFAILYLVNETLKWARENISADISVSTHLQIIFIALTVRQLGFVLLFTVMGPVALYYVMRAMKIEEKNFL
jgi:hypothetical protein